LSLVLFTVFINLIIVRPNDCGIGRVMNSMYIGCIIYADDIISASLSISTASGALMLRTCRLHVDHLSVCLSGKCTVAKRPIGSGCRLGWRVGSVEEWVY